MNKTYYLSYTAQQLIKENAACRAEGKTANNVILLSIALTAQRAACSLLSLYLCYISSKQCFEDMRFFKFSLHCQYTASPSTKKGVVIYKLVVAFELAQGLFSGRNLLVEVGILSLKKEISPVQCLLYFEVQPSCFRSLSWQHSLRQMVVSSKIEYLT